MDRLEATVDILQDRLCDFSIDDFEIYACSNGDLEIESRDQKVESLTRRQSSGVALRVIKGRKMGMSSTTRFDEDSIRRVVFDAVSGMEKMSDSDEAFFPKPLTGITPLAERPGRPLAKISEQEKIDVAFSIERAALKSHPNIVRVRHPRYRERTRFVYVTNSCGIIEKAERSLVFAEVQAVAEKKGVQESATEIKHHIRFEDLEAQNVGELAGKRAADMLGATSMKTGCYPAYLEPRAAASMLKILMPSFFADNIRKKKSLLANKHGQELFSKKISIVDDGLLPGGAGSFLFDDEGVWSQRTTVVDQGVIKGWLYDGANAKLGNLNSTGNARRPSMHSLPQISVTNSFILEGGATKEELISSCDDGLWITDLLGLHTANVISGDFSLGATGFLIDNGSRGRPIRKIMIAGNVCDFFNEVNGVGNDIAFFGAYGSPSITVPKLQINGDLHLEI